MRFNPAASYDYGVDQRVLEMFPEHEAAPCPAYLDDATYWRGYDDTRRLS